MESAKLHDIEAALGSSARAPPRDGGSLGRKRPTIFISYRRDDAAASAGRLFDWLARQFGRARIFLDTDKIASGDDFPRVLDERLRASDVLLVVIGPNWLTISDPRGRRIDQPDDFVRREIASGLERSIRVVPVLVGGARMPRADELPAALAALATHHAASIDDARFERDFDVLVDDLLHRSRRFVERQIDRVQRVVYVAKWSLLLVPALAFGCAGAVWTHVLDYLTLDSRVAGWVTRAADAIRPPTPAPQVLLVRIDAETERRLGLEYDPTNPGWPDRAAWRRNHARLVTRAAKAGAAAVAFDLGFEKASEADGELAQAARDARSRQPPTRVVFAVSRMREGQPDLVAALRDEAEWGSACMVERLGRFEAPLAVVHDPKDGKEAFRVTMPALALAAACPEVERSHADLRRRQVGYEGYGARFSAVERIGVPGGPCEVYGHTDDVAMLFIRRSPPGSWSDSARSVSYADLLDASAANGVSDERLRDRILLVGVTKHGLDELVVKRGLSSEVVRGIELHADAISNVLTGRVVTTPSVDGQLGITVAMVLAGAAASVFSVTASRAARRSLLGAAAALYVVATVALAAATGLLLNVHYDLAAFFAAHELLRRLQAPRVPATLREEERS